MICTNTMHLVAPRIESSISVPLLHIVDATGSALRAAGHQRVGLLGTRFTMSGEFYRGKLAADHGLEVVVPNAEEWDELNRVIFDELCRGKFTDTSREYYVSAIERLAAQGAEAVILGCTEIGLLIEAKDSPLPVFDTTWLHASAAVDFALSSR